MLPFGKEVIERTVNKNFTLTLIKEREDFLYCRRLLGLILIAENCEAK